MDEQQILTGLADGQTSSLEYLFRKYYTFLTKLSFYIIKDKDAAEDLTQGLFVTLWERRQQLDKVKNLKGYLSIAIKNKSLDYIKSQKVSHAHLEQYIQFSASAHQDQETDAERIKRQICDGLDSLPPKCRLIFSLNRFEGLTNDEIATYLQISKRTVETQVSKALKILRLELKDVLSRYRMIWIF